MLNFTPCPRMYDEEAYSSKLPEDIENILHEFAMEEKLDCNFLHDGDYFLILSVSKLKRTFNNEDYSWVFEDIIKLLPAKYTDNPELNFRLNCYQ